jgi:hypothetical protein
MDTFNIIKYDSSKAKLWDDFVDQAKNSYFFFKRGFMEYHSDRFQDHSLLIYKGNSLVALLPSHVSDNALNSHRGLTFGGFIVSDDLKVTGMYQIIEALKTYMKSEKLHKLVYKAMPNIYFKKPGDEDLFALYKAGAKLVCRDITSVINIKNSIKIAKGRRSCIKKAKAAGIQVKESTDYEAYFRMIEKLLDEKYQAKPVHNAQEISLLNSRFPNNIKLYISELNQKILAGVLVFIDERIVKTQYISSTEEGRAIGAVDIIIDELLNNIYSNREFFDFGTSTAKTEIGFNESLMQQKELFGARAVVKDVYELVCG